MSSNLLSRLLPPAGSPSIYDLLREHDRPNDDPDTNDDMEEVRIDEQNLDERFHDQDIDDLLAEATQSRVTTESTPFISPDAEVPPRSAGQAAVPSERRTRWLRDRIRFQDDDDVPESMLLGERAPEPESRRQPVIPSPPRELPPPVPGPSRTVLSSRNHTQQATPPRHDVRAQKVSDPKRLAGLLSADPVEQALWRWTNVVNLDKFLIEVYAYYTGKGIWSIILERAIECLTTAFVGVLLSFLTFCIDYKSIPGSKGLPDVVIPQCTQKIGGFSNILIWIVSFLWIMRVLHYILDFRRLWQMHDFYHHLLGIPDLDMQTISWQTVVSRLMDLRESNPRTATNLTAQARRTLGENSKQRMDAHDIANRIMRKENYLIALFNKEVLDFGLPIPFLGTRQLFSRNFEWWVQLSIMDHVFTQHGQVNQLFLKDTHRQALIDTMRSRCITYGYLSALCAPFITVYLVSIYILRFFTEFQKNPAALGARAYTPLAEWRIREFNEVWHMFERRIDMSIPFASRYIDQFPKHKTVQVAKFLAFVSGALSAVLAIASLLDPDLFLGFEITHDRTVLFYLGILTTIWAVTRGVVPAENQVFDPEYAIQNVIDYTHFQPTHWKGRLHSDEVRQEFAQLYRPKVLNFLEELASVIFTPFILWFCLPGCAERLIDFFREFTVHVDGLGYVCSFALFEFQRGGPTMTTKPSAGRSAAQDPRDEYYATKDNKMLASYFNFLDTYGNNTRRAIPREARKKDFHPPPAFPALTTSQMTVTGTAPVITEDPTSDQPLAASLFRDRNPINANQLNASPSPSLLLDARHQPSTVAQPRRKGQRGPSKLRQVDASTSLPPAAEIYDSQPTTASETEMEESNLGDSWKTTRGAPANDDETVSELEGMQGEGGAGVLGMIYQFQKAQTEGRAGVGI